MIPVTCFSGRTLAVFGLGLSGIAAARALIAGGAQVLAWDDSDRARASAQAAGVPLTDLCQADLARADALVVTPGVPLTHPEPHWAVARARAAGIEIIGDTELFNRERKHRGSRAKIAAITGTNGKSTTTALTAHLLRAAGRRASMGGNIGKPVLELPSFADNRTYVIEYSSFQIDLTPNLQADAAALLNISPDHLDRHGDLAAYAAIKERIFAHLAAGGAAIIGLDDPLSKAAAERLEKKVQADAAAAPRLIGISAAEAVRDGVYVRDGLLFEAEAGLVQAPISLRGLPALRGAHNWQNAAAAFAMARSLGLSREEIAEGLRSFPGLAHRMEEVGRHGRVLFVNDSKATNADAAGKALACFQPIHWIIGGRAKDSGLDGLEAFFPRIAKAYLIGEAAPEFARVLNGKLRYEQCGTLERAVERAARDALASPAPQPVVLLSPACASYDQFPNFAARGESFRRAVAALDGVAMREAIAA